MAEQSEAQTLVDQIPENTESVVIVPAFDGRFRIRFVDTSGARHKIPGTFSVVTFRRDGTIEYGTD